MKKEYSLEELKKILKSDITIPPIVQSQAHNAFEQIYPDFDKNKNQTDFVRYKKKKRFKMYLTASAAAIMLFGTLTAGAAALFHWDPVVADKFNVTKEQQQILADKQAVVPLESKDTVNDVTISTSQILMDDKYMYLLFKIAAPDNIPLNENTFFENTELTVEGEPIEASYYGSILNEPELLLDSPEENAVYWETWVEVTEGVNLQGKNVTATFTNLTEQQPSKELLPVLYGEWKLTWNIDYQGTVKTFEINQTLEEYNVTIKNITLSPISARILYEYPRDEKTGEAIQEDGTVTETLYYDDPICLSGIKLRDGSLAGEFFGPGSCGYTTTTGTEWLTSISSTKIIPVNDVISFLFGQEEQIEIPVNQ